MFVNQVQMLCSNSRAKVRTNLLAVALLIKVIAEFRPLMGTALIGIINLLKDSDVRVRLACVKVLSNLSAEG
jgi:HEAT repeat